MSVRPASLRICPPRLTTAPLVLTDAAPALVVLPLLLLSDAARTSSVPSLRSTP